MMNWTDVPPGDVRLFEQAETAARALLNAVVELKRRFNDREPYEVALDQAHTLVWRVRTDLERLPSTVHTARIAGTIPRSGGDHPGPDGNAA